MSDKKNNNELPDISKVFDIDEKKIPDKIIKKDPESNKPIENPVLTSDEARKVLPREDRKVLKEEDKKKKKITFTNKVRKNFIIALAVFIAILIAGFVIGGIVKNASIPEITLTTPVVEQITRTFTTEKAITVNSYRGTVAIFFDNAYNEHYLEVGQTVVMINEKGNSVPGKIVDIIPEKPDSPVISRYYELLEGSVPSTEVCTIYILPDDRSMLTEKDERLQSVSVETKKEEKALTLPAETVIIEEGEKNLSINRKYFVLVYSEPDGKVFRQRVTTGISAQGKIQITGDLDPEAKVVLTCTEPLEDIEDGTKVKVKK